MRTRMILALSLLALAGGCTSKQLHIYTTERPKSQETTTVTSTTVVTTDNSGHQETTQLPDKVVTTTNYHGPTLVWHQ